MDKEKNFLDNNKIFELFKFNSKPEDLSTDTLAYIGDSVYSLYFKLVTLTKAHRRVNFQNELAKNYVSHTSQFQSYKTIKNELNEYEISLIRRGYNSKGAKKRGSNEEYRISTGLETLVGYLFITKNIDRLKYLLERIEEDVSSRKKRT